LRTRASRMAPFGDVSEVEETLGKLINRTDGPFVTKLAREPGRRDSRYAHLFSGPVVGSVGHGADQHAVAEGEPRAITRAGSLEVVEVQAPSQLRGDVVTGEQGSSVLAPEVSFPASRNDQRLARVEQEVLALRAELEDLKRRLGG
jgi:uncharacterized protein YceH (UPF0502 family)